MIFKYILKAFTCECPKGFTDRSPNRQHRPGRVCVKLIDECKEGRHTCSPNADCRDLEEVNFNEIVL